MDFNLNFECLGGASKDLAESLEEIICELGYGADEAKDLSWKLVKGLSTKMQGRIIRISKPNTLVRRIKIGQYPDKPTGWVAEKVGCSREAVNRVRRKTRHPIRLDNKHNVTK